MLNAKRMPRVSVWDENSKLTGKVFSGMENLEKYSGWDAFHFKELVQTLMTSLQAKQGLPFTTRITKYESIK